MNGVVLIAVVHVVIEVFVECGGFHLSVGVGDGDDLMLRELHGSGLMDVDMTTAHTDNTFILVEHRVDGGGIGLGATCQEEDLGIGHAAGFADTVLGPFAELVEAVGRRLDIFTIYKFTIYELLPAKLHKVSRLLADFG